MTLVLTVDDDPAILRTLSINLKARGYGVEIATDGRSALQIVHECMPDAILLDLGLPDLDGIAVLRQVRSFSQVPVIVVSARAESDDKVEALDLGADDYVSKPFSMEELLARVRAATRRNITGAVEPVVQVGGLLIDSADSKATRDGVIIHLTPTEWKIVSVLVRNRGRLVRQADLLHEVWGPGYEQETNYLRVHLASIRRKLEPDPGEPRLFITEAGLGYRFNPA
ncbi:MULTISPECIES: response regulator [Aeromicrobium]|uniref:Response regulator n=1 Tax=Aeromicrobium yanjiei TaxID=2662028 RepID=A0A5Q2MKV1_9ACTN|nr:MULTISPECIES: response regulator transcription factor [Aeromicrobium]MRK00757.1 response regulator [Aeromicrobium sp. S22]QGG42421.1 response regulator [Aeromicrobium yanjiei]